MQKNYVLRSRSRVQEKKFPEPEPPQNRPAPKPCAPDRSRAVCWLWSVNRIDVQEPAAGWGGAGLYPGQGAHRLQHPGHSKQVLSFRIRSLLAGSGIFNQIRFRIWIFQKVRDKLRWGIRFRFWRHAIDSNGLKTWPSVSTAIFFKGKKKKKNLFARNCQNCFIYHVPYSAAVEGENGKPEKYRTISKSGS